MNIEAMSEQNLDVRQEVQPLLEEGILVVSSNSPFARLSGFFQEKANGIREKIQTVHVSPKIGLTVGTFIAGLAIACGSGHAKTGESISPTATSDRTVTTSPAMPVSTEGPQLSTPIPTETSTPAVTPEAKQETPCNIFPLKICKEAERITYKGITYMGFKDVPAGTKIFAPEGGSISTLTDGDQPLYGSGVFIRTKNYSIQIRGGFDINPQLQPTANAGDSLGQANTLEQKSLGEYKMVVAVTTKSTTGTGIESVNQVLDAWFPDAPKTSKEFASQIGDKPGVAVTYLGQSSN